MPRPKRTRNVGFEPRTDYFKPRGIPMRALEEVGLAIEELEALRLADLEDLDQATGAERMGVSRPTFARVLHEARAKVADALVNGKALRIEGGDFAFTLRRFRCYGCGTTWTEPFGTGRPAACPGCGGAEFRREDGASGLGGDPGFGGPGHRHGGGRGRGRHGRGGRGGW